MNVKVPIKVKSTNKTPLFSTASKNREKEGVTQWEFKKKTATEENQVWEKPEEKEIFQKELYPELVFLKEGEILKTHIKPGLWGWWPSGDAQEGAPHPHKHFYPVLCVCLYVTKKKKRIQK